MDNDNNKNTFPNDTDGLGEKVVPPTRNKYKLSDTSKKIIAAGLGILLVLIVIIFAASQSAPGQGLYGFKTNVLENIVESTHFSSKSKASYQVMRMENRLDELKTLMEDGVSDQASLDALHAQAQKHQETLAALVTAESANFSMEDRLFIVNNFAALAAAMEVLSESKPEYMGLGDQMEDIRRHAVNLHQETAKIFIQSTSAQSALDFIKVSLAEVSEKLNTPDLSVEVIDDSEEYIDRAALAIKDKKYERAITAIAEAFRFVQVEEYAGKLQRETPRMNSASSTPKTGTSSVPQSTSTIPLPQ